MSNFPPFFTEKLPTVRFDSVYKLTTYMHVAKGLAHSNVHLSMSSINLKLTSYTTLTKKGVKLTSSFL